jgi:predicted nucleotidyltransferase
MDLPVDVESLRRTLRDRGVGFALVFGSHATGHAHEGSDVDLAVWAPGPIDDWRLRGALGEVVDLLDLTGAPDGLAGRVAMTGVVVLDDDPPRRIRWQADTRKRHLDEAFRRDRFRRDFVASHG